MTESSSKTTCLGDLTGFAARRAGWVVAAWLAWMAVLLGSYYRPFGPSFAADFAIASSRTFQRAILEFLGLLMVAILLVLSGRFLRENGRQLRKGKLLDRKARLVGLLFLMGILVVLVLFLSGRSDALFAGHRRFPAFGEAVGRALAGLSGASLVLLAADFLGWVAFRLLSFRFEEKGEERLFRLAAGLGVLAYVFLMMALLGFYRPSLLKLLVCSLGLCRCVVFIGGRLARRTQDEDQVGDAVTVQPAAGVANFIWKIVVAMAFLAAGIGALAPETEYDALWYHLGLPQAWLEQGFLTDPLAEYVSLYPMTWELLFGGGLALGGPLSAKLLHFSCFVLTGAAVFLTVRRFVPKASPWLAVALFATAPSVLWEATTAYNDLAVALHITLTFYAILRWLSGRQAQWFGLAAFNLGIGLATKHLALFALLILALGLTLKLWQSERNFKRALRTGVVFTLLSLLPALPWYLRSWQHSGNPVFPTLYTVFGARPPERWDANSQRGLDRFLSRFGRPRTLANQSTLPWDLTVHAARYGGSVGPLFLLLLPLLIVVHRRQRLRGEWAGTAVGYFALWASPVSSFQMRFLLPIIPILAILAAEAANRLSELGKLVGRFRWEAAFTASFSVLFFLNFPSFIPLQERDRQGFQGWLTHVVRKIPVRVVVGMESQETYLVRTVPSYAAWRFANERLPTSARVLTFSGGDHYYSRRDRIWSDAALAWPAVWGSPAGMEHQAILALSRLGISHLLVDKRQLQELKAGAPAILQPSFVAKWCEALYEDQRFVLYRIRRLRNELGEGGNSGGGTVGG